MGETKTHLRRRRRVFEYFLIILIETITLLLLSTWLDGLTIESAPSAIGVAAIFIIAQVIYWWLFINFFSRLPIWLYPVFTFFLADLLIILFGNLIPGIHIQGFTTGLWIAVVLTGVTALLGGLFSLDIDDRFDRYVIQPLVARRGNPILTDVPGFLFLEIDGLSEKIFRKALAEGHMPTLKRWLDRGTHKIMGWETDFTSQTAAMQAGILLGNNEDVPAYRWWDRVRQRVVLSGDPRDAISIEDRLSRGIGLLAGGGSSRGNIFSGDAAESLFTSATLLNPQRDRGPGFYLYLLNPFIVARLAVEFIAGVVKEWCQNLLQRLRRDRYSTSARTPFYAFIRAAVGPFLQDLITYTVIADVLRGIPAVYALYAAYDDVAHYTGIDSRESFDVLEGIDRYFARIERALSHAPRPYYSIVLSDHGQSVGRTFQKAYGVTLKELVEGLIHTDSKVFANLNTHESWDKVNAFFSESIHADTRMASLLRRMLRSKTQNGLVSTGPERSPKNKAREKQALQDAHVIVLASGCTGLIYLADHGRRLTYEEIQDRHPELILGLAQHPGTGFLLVRSQEQGDLVIHRGGIYFLKDDTFEGENPLAVYGSNAPRLLKRESNFPNCPDIIVNTRYDPATEELCGFENQVGHHGGLGGPQNSPFIFYPAGLPDSQKPVVGAIEVHRLLRGWRDRFQATNGTCNPAQSQSEAGDGKK